MDSEWTAIRRRIVIESPLLSQDSLVFWAFDEVSSQRGNAMAKAAPLMQRVYIGTKTVTGAFERYAKRFNLLEVRTDLDVAPSLKTLRKWRKQVPPTFAFSVALPSVVASLTPSKDADRELERAVEMATLLESPVMLIANPPSVRPTATNRKRLADLVKRMPNDVVRLAWEPSGLWEYDEARVVASHLGLVLVGDAARDPLGSGSVAYTRLRGLGDSRRLSPSRLAKAVERLRHFREVFAIIETDAPVSVMKAIRAAAVLGDEESRVMRTRHVAYP
ncbi:MAG: DUF72 domain-containing protein, partial [Polyangiaceae bacterium]|nr:DUF72 domain-containing protein [Polyangiaceae bacterium]